MTMKTISKKLAGVRVTTAIKAAGINTGNHNRRLVGLTVRSGVKTGEGILSSNHNRRASVLAVKTGLKAGEGILSSNHSRRVA
jgi:hypothetical protein